MLGVQAIIPISSCEVSTLFHTIDKVALGMMGTREISAATDSAEMMVSLSL